MLVPAMKCVMLVAVLGLGACGTTDDRPQTLAYVTEAILAPNCASAECHSQLRQSYGYVFDTVAHSLASMQMNNLVVPGDPDSSYLLQVISTQDSKGNRMPLDAPLDNKDIDFIGVWITNGADGFTPPPP